MKNEDNTELILDLFMNVREGGFGKNGWRSDKN